jgi:hypothetical protein
MYQDPKELHVTPTPTPTRLSAWLEQVWLLRYLDRQLDGDETKWFEAYILDKPDMLALIEADLDLRDALAAEAARPAGPAATDASARISIDAVAANDVQPTAVGAIASRPVSSPGHAGRSPAWLGLAAAVLVGLGAGWLASGARAPAGAPTLVPSPTRIIYDTMRGEAAPPRVEHADSRSPYVLVEVAVPPGAENIVLKMAQTPEQGLTPSPDGFVSFFVRRETLAKSRDARIEYRILGKETRVPIAFR